MRKHIIRMVAMAMAALMLLSATAFAAPIARTGGSTSSSSGGALYSDNQVPYGKSPTTGLDWEGEYKPLLVQIANNPAERPHWNLSEADIVYESILAGPYYTRYTAVYSDSIPSFVGAIRSARLHHVILRQEWDCPLVFYGGQDIKGTSIYDFFKSYNVDKSFRFDGIASGAYSKGYTRETTRVSPHNVSANLQQMMEAAYPNHTPRSHAFKFTDTPAAGYDSAVAIEVPYGEKDYIPSYEYNESTREYERLYNGEPQIDGYSNERIVASNVIIQRTKTTYYGNMSARPLVEMLGEGDADYFIGGRHIKGKWVHEDYNSRTIFLDESGNEIELLPGKTFIQIVPNTLDFTYTRKDGTVIRPLSDANITEEETAELYDDGIEDLDKMAD